MHKLVQRSSTISTYSGVTKDMQNTKLSSLQLGKAGTIIRIEATDITRRRLQDLGFILGAEIECVFTSPLGDPRAYRINDSVIALRYEEASQIIIQT